MRILVTNDDGVYAPGIKVLSEVAHTISSDVWVVAPEVEQSGSGHSLTLMLPLRIKQLSKRKYWINGTPTDCIQIALKDLLKNNLPDLVISGINYGANLGEDVTCSGTIAAAIEATILDIPSIAFSLSVKHKLPEQWDTAKHFAPIIIKKLLLIKWPKNILINVNFPNLPIEKVKGIICVRHGIRHEKGEITEWHDPRNEKFYWLASNTRIDDSHDKDTDLAKVLEGYITITPLDLDLTHYETLQKMSKKLDELF